MVGSAVAKTIVSSGPQLAPRAAPTTGHSVTGGPPAIATFRSSRARKEPDPAAVGREERTAGVGDAGERYRVERIDRPDHQLPLIARHIDEVRAIGGQDEVAMLPVMASACAAGGARAKRIGCSVTGAGRVSAHVASAATAAPTKSAALAMATVRRRGTPDVADVVAAASCRPERTFQRQAHVADVANTLPRVFVQAAPE